MKMRSILAIVITGLGLTACSSNYMHTSANGMDAGPDGSQSGQIAMTGTVGGNIGTAMDASDQHKMSRALDNPLGKPTHWDNFGTGTSYTVVPTRKVVINGNQFCRQYTTTATHGGNAQQMNGTACITADGNWHPVNG